MTSLQSIAPCRNPDAAEVRRQPPTFDLVRDCPLPCETIAARVDAIRVYYWRLTGRELAYPDAIQALDRIVADRRGASPYDPRPIPVALAPVAEYLVSERYSPEEIYLTVREIERAGTAALSCALDGEDREEVEARIPQSVRAKGRFEAFA